MHYYSHHLGDYAKDTGHLSLAEHGAYRLLLDHYYSTESALPVGVEALYRICRANSKQEKQAVQSVIGQFFKCRENGFFSTRAEVEIQDFKSKIEKAKNAGIQSGIARRTGKTTNGRSTDVQRTFDSSCLGVRTPDEPSINQEPRTIVLLEKEPKTPQEELPGNVRLDSSLPQELHDGWKEWQEYRKRRSTAKGRDKLAWTLQAARLGAMQVAAYSKSHGPQIVADRIASAIGGNWQGLNLDKITERASGFARPEDKVSHTGREAGFDF